MAKENQKKSGWGAVYQKWGVFLILIVEIILFSIMSGNFLTVDNIMTIGRQVATTGIATVGATLLMISGGIDISNGSVQAFTGVIVAMLLTMAGVPIFAAVIIAVLLGTVFGAINGVAFAKFNVSPLIATLSMQTIVKGISFLITDASPIYGLSDSFKWIGQGYLFGVIPIPLIIMIICFVFSYWILNKTYFGRYLYAVGGNTEAARLSGINTKVIFIIVFAASALFASISGVVMAARLGSGQPGIADSLPMDVITGVVLGGVGINGGTGKIGGVLVGVLIMGILSNGMILVGLNEYWQWVVKGLVLIFAVAMSNIKIKKA